MSLTPFPQTYAEARQRFRYAARGLPQGALEVAEDLTIDWAWKGDRDARRVVVYSSGLHGVEGYGGHGAQLATLAEEDGPATLYVHAQNPYGMANLRRVNESNVDLNRNFFPDGHVYGGCPDAYAQLDGLLNPPSAPGFDAFWLQAGWAVLRHGYGALRNAIVSGQYAYPKGLFYGGAKRERSTQLLLDFYVQELAGREVVVHVDWHSALGEYGARTLLLEGKPAPEQVARVEAALGKVRTWDASDPAAYDIHGGLTAELARRLPGVRYDALTCEFGTRGNLQVLAALRAENRWHHHGGGGLDSPYKQAMRETFAPTAPEWEQAVLRHAREVGAGVRTLVAA